MLLTVPATQLFQENTATFINTPEVVLELNHSLKSVADWESKWEKPFIKTVANKELTQEMLVDYVKCMIVNYRMKLEKPTKYPISEVFKDTYEEEEHKRLFSIAALSYKDTGTRVIQLLDEKKTATWFTENQKNTSKTGEVVTAEVLYYDMIKLTIPMECQYWHLNRLLTLIRVFGEKDNPKKMPKNEILERNRALNKQRLAKAKARRGR